MSKGIDKFIGYELKEQIQQSPHDINFNSYNNSISNEDDHKLSQRNLIMMYIYLYIYYSKNENENEFKQYLSNTTYFNKVLFLKYLSFFIKVNKFEQQILVDEQKFYDEQQNLEQQQLTPNINSPINIDEAIKKIAEANDTILETIIKINNFKENFSSVTISLLTNDNYIYNPELQLSTLLSVSQKDILDEVSKIIATLFDHDTLDNIYRSICEDFYFENEKYNEYKHNKNYNEYKNLFHLNINNTINTINTSSYTASFFIGFHGHFYIETTSNQYLTIASPVNTTINRWGTRGVSTKYFNTMKYTLKQCLLRRNPLNKDEANICFNLLGTSLAKYNYDTSQHTTSLVYDEMMKNTSNNTAHANDVKNILTTCNNNVKIETDKIPVNTNMRIKHYSVDSTGFEFFNNDYTLPNDLLNDILDRVFVKIELVDNDGYQIQYNNAENIMKLNFSLFTNNINFSVFEFLDIKKNVDETDTIGLYPEIGLFTDNYKFNKNVGDNQLQSSLLDFYFPLDIFTFKPELLIEDFVLERDIFALNDINIHLQYENVDRSFMLLKGDSFSSNPYIIEYFIKTFKSKITIRPGPILGNSADNIFKDNIENQTTIHQGATITSLSKGLSCYKVTLSVLTNYEILKFCKDANINTCDLYDTSCQSFSYINDKGEKVPDISQENKLTLQKKNTIKDTYILPVYDNLSGITFSNIDDAEKRNFVVVGMPKEELKLKRKINNLDESDGPYKKIPNLGDLEDFDLEGGRKKKQKTKKKKQKTKTFSKKQKTNKFSKKQKTNKFSKKVKKI